MKDSSLRVPPGIEGIVIDAKVFTRKGGEKDDRARMLEDRDLERLYRDQEDETRIIFDAALGKIRAQLLGKTSAVRLTSEDKAEVLLAKRKKLTEEVLDEIPKERWAEIGVEEDPELKARLSDAWRVCLDQVALVKAMFEEKISRIRRGDELPPGVLKICLLYTSPSPRD